MPGMTGERPPGRSGDDQRGTETGVRDLALRVHPPPDLAIEVEVTHSSMDRMEIYATLGIPGLWRLDGDELRFHVLGALPRNTRPAGAAVAGDNPHEP